jgi:hypothetical protein
MISRRTFHLPLVCLLIFSLLTTSASASGYIWCVSADGDHAALEFAQSGDCSLDNCVPAEDGATALALKIAADDCGPCLDISASHQWNVSRCRQNDAPLNIPADSPPVVVAACLPPAERTIPSHWLVDRNARTSGQLVHHRTIVLLI